MIGFKKPELIINSLLVLSIILGVLADQYHWFGRHTHQEKSIEQGLTDFEITIAREKQEKRKRRIVAAPKDTSIHPININTADKEAWMQVPRIGPVLAQRIIDYREKHGPFRSIEHLQSVKGIGAKTLAKMRPYLVISQ